MDDLYCLDPFNNSLSTITDISGSDLRSLTSGYVASRSSLRASNGFGVDDDEDEGEEEESGSVTSDSSSSSSSSSSVTFSSKYYLTNETISDSEVYDLTCTSYDVTRILVCSLLLLFCLSIHSSFLLFFSLSLHLYLSISL